MLKKIFCAALMAAIIFVGNQVSAEDVWICSEGNADYYVKTETFVNRTEYRDDRKFSVEVVIVIGLGAELKNYSFRENDGLIYCNIDGEDNFVRRNTPEDKIWNYGLKYLGIDYEVRYD